MLPTPSDPLAVLAADPAVAEAVAGARSEIDALLWRRDVRAAAAEVAAASAARGGRDSAVLDGADLPDVDDSPMGRTLDAALRITEAVPGQVDVFTRAPLQVIAHLHSLGAANFLEDDERGRPRSADLADDPLNLGLLPPAAAARDRLTLLGALLTRETHAPALVVAAIAHAEIATARPFAWGSGLVARAMTRLVLASRGVDPSLFSIPELGIVALGRTKYVRALQGYQSGTTEGVTAFIAWHAAAIAEGARAVVVPAS